MIPGGIYRVSKKEGYTERMIANLSGLVILGGPLLRRGVITEAGATPVDADWTVFPTSSLLSHSA